MITGWIDPGLLQDFQAEGTDAHRLYTIEDGWVERFGSDVLISFKTVLARERLLEELQTWADSVGIHVRRVFARFIPRKSERREPPALVIGDPSESLQTVVTEWYLRFGIDFGAGYSSGLFLDQRENRRYVRHIAPRRLLNCFAYTCSFSVCAACNGASTVNIDLSKKSLTRGRENFALNNLSTVDHQFITDDVQSVLPRFVEMEASHGSLAKAMLKARKRHQATSPVPLFTSLKMGMQQLVDAVVARIPPAARGIPPRPGRTSQ